MFGVSLLATLLTICGGLAIVLMGLLIYRAVVGIHEEDQIFLDRAEAALEKEQAETIARINRLDPIIKALAIAVGGLLLIIVGIWLYRGLYGPQTM